MAINVSVIIPTYNRSDYLKLTLESVLAQTFQDFEVVVVDNGSTDDTEEVVRSYADSRVRYEVYTEAKRVALVRNYGVSVSNGKYIAFLDSDDLWHPEKLAKSMEVFDEDVGLVYTAKKNIDKDGNDIDVFMEEKQVTPSGWVFERLLWNSFTYPSALIVRRDVFDDVGGFGTRYYIAEDYEWFLKVAQKYQFRCVNEPLLLYRVHAESSSQRLAMKGIEIIQLFSSLLSEYGSLSPLGRRGIMRHMAYGHSLIGRWYALAGNHQVARRFFRIAMAYKFNLKTAGMYTLTMFGKRTFERFYKAIYRNIK